jgi:hypothetical protein
MAAAMRETVSSPVLANAAGKWRLDWVHGSAEVQALGGMLGPVALRLPDGRELDIMHVAPWSGMTAAEALPGVLRRLRGEWPCVPFGRADQPQDLPAGWRTHPADDDWAHGYASNHAWRCIEADTRHVHLAIDYPADAPVAAVERVIALDPHPPAQAITLTNPAPPAITLPAGLHPTFRLPPAAGRVQVVLGAHDGIHSYPANPPGAVSRLRPGTVSTGLHAMAGIDGALDLSRLPLAMPGEELVQVRALRAEGTEAPFTLHYLDYDACVGLWWDGAQLPDLMLWISNGGRAQFPWLGRHVAIGAEPVNSLFDLGRVASAPPGHPLADRLGVVLDPARPLHLRYRIAAWPQSANLASESSSHAS